MTILGYYLTCDDAQCVDCYERDGGLQAWLDEGGFEEWPDPLAITSGDESDTPTHCVTCEALIPHQLTSDGMDYVQDAYTQAIQGGQGSLGRHAIVRAWVEEYLPEHADKVADWPTRDRWSPKEKTA